MPQEQLRDRFAGLLMLAGVELNGPHDWDIQVHNEALFARVLAKGSLGLGESYMDGWWDCRQLDEFFCRILRAELDSRVVSWRERVAVLKAILFNLQRGARAFQIDQRHYGIGNDLFRRMLDKQMLYTSGYWKQASNLDEAQEAKLELVARKLQLQPGMRVLDIGCGWGGTAKVLAERYGIKVVGITVSEEQANMARELCQGTPVEIRLRDYRDVEGNFDRILSLGMFEHVGRKNYLTFMRTVRAHLEPDGLFLLETIGKNVSTVGTDPWIARYIFPNSMISSAQWISAAVERLFVIEDWHNFGADYARTLLAWKDNFQNSWNEIGQKYGERFRRMWDYYLCSCAGAFRARQLQNWQIVFSPSGVSSGYQACR
jgi:cyclopropane-fatty-acyl-phospholipid synthase